MSEKCALTDQDRDLIRRAVIAIRSRKELNRIGPNSSMEQYRRIQASKAAFNDLTDADVNRLSELAGDRS